MNKPTILELINMTGRILSISGAVYGLVCGIEHNKDRPTRARMIINLEIRSTDQEVWLIDPNDSDPDHRRGHTFQVYETAEIDRRWIALVWPPLLLSPSYYYDIQIQEE